MRLQLKLVALSMMALSAGRSVQAQDSLKTTRLDEYVVIGTRVETPVEKSGKMIYRISSEDMLKSGSRNVADVLNRVPGIQMDGNFGAPGSNLDYFVRGASSKRTLILIDGVPFNDPSGIDLTFDLRLIDINQIESIEVLRGGLSSLYGSGAAAAVINIKMKKAGKGKLNASAGIDYGSFNTLSNYWNVNGRINKFSYQGSIGLKSSDGFSAAKDPGVGGFDKDGLSSENANVQFGYQLSKKLILELHTSYDHFENQFDAFSFTDDKTSGSDYLQKRVGMKTTYSTAKSSLSGSYFINYLDRRFNYGGFPDNYDGVNEQGNVQMSQTFSEIFTLIGGLDYQRLAYEQPFQQESSFTIKAPYLSWMMQTGHWNVQLGGRVNHHSDYGYNWVYNINPSYSFDLGPNTLKVLANYSTSYITPSLYQLNGPYGNSSLNPEESENGDVGMSFSNGKGLEINTAYFQRIDTRPIAFESFFDVDFNFLGGEYYNADGQSRVEGVEMDFRYSMDKWSFNGNYTWLNNIWGSLRQRIPRLKAGFGLSYEYAKGSNISSNYSWTGTRLQNDPQTFELVSTKSFGLVNLAINQKLGKLTAYGTINNLMNTEFEAILGYSTIGRNYTVGMRMDLIGK
jgi:vitamin B12 transporter